MAKSTKGKGLKEWFGQRGRLAKVLPRFEPRDGQVSMAKAVARTISNERILIVEAATGTGKTLAYLLPTVLKGKQVLVATGTIALQEQLFHKDLPLLRKAGLKIDSVLLKGRAHYLCLLKHQRLVREPPLGFFRDKPWLSIHRWAQETATGDRAELTDVSESDPRWAMVTADADSCPGRACRLFNQCHLFRHRRDAEKAQIIVINHHLLFSNAHLLATRGTSILPQVDCLVLDEAHLLEETASSAFSTHVGFGAVRRMLQHLQDVLHLDTPVSGKEMEFWSKVRNDIQNAASRLFQSRWSDLRNNLSWPDACRDQTFLRDVKTLRHQLFRLATSIKALDLQAEDSQTLCDRIDRLVQECDLFTSAPTDAFVRYIEPFTSRVSHMSGWTMKATPINVDALFHEFIWDVYPSTILTSATIRVLGRFDYFRERIGLDLDKVDTLAIPTPFNMREQARLWVPRNLPLPQSSHFLPAILDVIPRIIRLVQGRTLVLCTSFLHVRAIADRLAHDLDYPVFVQGETSKRKLMDAFREQIESVLVATSGFWQGFDVPGESLSCVIIDKIPFDVPTDPVMEAKIDQMKKRGQNPFENLQLPRALLTLRQGLGRLIRHREDMGILVLLDGRVWQRHYGQNVLAELEDLDQVETFDELERYWTAVDPHRSHDHRPLPAGRE